MLMELDAATQREAIHGTCHGIWLTKRTDEEGAEFIVSLVDDWRRAAFSPAMLLSLPSAGKSMRRYT